MSEQLCNTLAPRELASWETNTVPNSVLKAGFSSVEALLRAYKDVMARTIDAGYPTFGHLLETHDILMQDNLALRTKLARAECQVSSLFKDTTLPYVLFPVDKKEIEPSEPKGE